MGATIRCALCAHQIDGQPEATLAHLVACEQGDASMMRDALTGRAWLTFPSKPSAEVIAALKGEGWRWSGYRKAWNNPRKGILPPAIVGAWEDDGTCDYASERADRLDASAEKAEARSASAHAKVRAIADHIPFGQPILVGHHSERHARRDAERIGQGMRRAVEEGRKAERLADAAEASRAHQAHLQSAPVIARRIKKLEAEYRRCVRSGWSEERLAAVRALINTQRAALAAAGGPPEAEYAAGDIVRGPHGPMLVLRANKATLTLTIMSGGAMGMGGLYDLTKVRGVMRKADASTVALAAECRKVRFAVEPKIKALQAWAAAHLSQKAS